ncbi:PrsW family intramembrane metalloprotease, partial [bacterium]|nr:PrsW family intramembrane metalloprotease [bacterium]
AMILGSVWLTNKNELAPIIMTLQTQIMVDPKNMTSVIEEVGQLLQNPGVVAAIFFSLSIVTPLVEEFFKPLALWFFIKRGWSEAEGFSAGLVLGAAFALVESVSAVAALPQESWSTLLVARVGTGLLHTLTTGLTGWALVFAWKTGKYGRLGLVYLISMTLHGFWNFFALVSGLGTNLDLFAQSSFAAFISSAPWVLAVLFAGMLFMLFFMNRRIRLSSPQPPALPPLPTDTLG